MANNILLNLFLKYSNVKTKPKKQNAKIKKIQIDLLSDFSVNPLNQNYKNDMLTRAIKNTPQSTMQEVFFTIMTYLKKYRIDMEDYLFFNESFYNEYNPLSHSQRVLLYISYIAIIEKVSVNDFKLLINAAKLHDIGRNSYISDPLHGFKGADIIKKYELIKLDSYSLNSLLTIIDAHSAYDQSLEGILYKYEIMLSDYDRVKKLAYILKDAEALDKARFLNDNKVNPDKLIKINLLKTKAAKELINFAVELNEQYKTASTFTK